MVRGIMRNARILALAGPVALGCIAPALPVDAQQRPDEQNEARRDLRAGHVQSLRDIERRVVPMQGGMQYLGPEYDPEAMAYRLKFIRDGRVMFVDVDARTGQVRGRSSQ